MAPLKLCSSEFTLFSEVPKIANVSRSINVLGVASDVAIAVTLIFLLQRSRTGFKRSETIINRLILFTINTGLLTSMCAIMSLISVRAFFCFKGFNSRGRLKVRKLTYFVFCVDYRLASHFHLYHILPLSQQAYVALQRINDSLGLYLTPSNFTVYTNTLFATLNARKSLVGGMPDDTDNNHTGSVSMNRIRPRATEIEPQSGSRVS